jgi:hypothetical protein
MQTFGYSLEPCLGRFCALTFLLVQSQGVAHYVYQYGFSRFRDSFRDILRLRIGQDGFLEFELNKLASVKLFLYVLDELLGRAFFSNPDRGFDYSGSFF